MLRVAKVIGVSDRANVRFCPQSGHTLVRCKSPLSGVKRTWTVAPQMSAYDPKRALGVARNTYGIPASFLLSDVFLPADGPGRFSSLEAGFESHAGQPTCLPVKPIEFARLHAGAGASLGVFLVDQVSLHGAPIQTSPGLPIVFPARNLGRCFLTRL